MNFQSICQIERQLANLASENWWWDTKVIDMWPLFRQTPFTDNPFSAMLPEQMLVNIRLVSIRDAATIAQMMQLMFPHVIREFTLQM